MDRLDFEISATVDDSGFVVLVCPESYVGFIGEHWTLKQVMSRFVEQMNEWSLFVTYPGADLADKPLRISGKASPQPCIRQVSGLVQVKERGLWLTDYSALTMAAQFADEPPINSWHVQLPVPPGLFRIVLRQFAQSWEDESESAAELVIVPATDGDQAIHQNAVPWFDE